MQKQPQTNRPRPPQLRKHPPHIPGRLHLCLHDHQWPRHRPRLELGIHHSSVSRRVIDPNRFQAQITDPLYDQIRVLTLPVWRCPSDSVELPLFPVQSSGGTTITQVAFANYVGVAGTDEVSVYPDTGTGVLFRNKSIAIKQITDGLSHTLMVGERDSHKSPQTTWVGALTNSVIPPLNPTYDNEGPPVLILTNTGTVADDRVPNNALDHVEDSNSAHPQGVHFMFADGSVQAINNDIDPNVWVALGTRAGDESNGQY